MLPPLLLGLQNTAAPVSVCPSGFPQASAVVGGPGELEGSEVATEEVQFGFLRCWVVSVSLSHLRDRCLCMDGQ